MAGRIIVPDCGKVLDAGATRVSVRKSPTHPALPRASAPADDLDQALDHLYELHASDVERWVARLAGPRADCEDLIHDVFVVALRRRREFRGEASLRTWLFRITHRVVSARRRRDRLRRFLFTRGAAELAPTPAPTAVDEIERREQHQRLYRALDRLPDTYRTALVLYELEALSGEEVAELLGIEVGALWVRLHRGRAKLLAALRERR
jgi:RNA polymerase sigma-70 factor, ECF subfamily